MNSIDVVRDSSVQVLIQLSVSGTLVGMIRKVFPSARLLHPMLADIMRHFEAFGIQKWDKASSFFI
jgi:hypothetical protein